MAAPEDIEMNEPRPGQGHNLDNDGREGNENYAPRRYHRLARIMRDDKNLAIFRRFDEINIIELMALQAEIVELQRMFQSKCKEDDSSGQTYSGSFHSLRQTARSRLGSPLKNDNHTNNAGLSQSDLLELLRSKLVDYNNLLLQMSEMSRLRTPQRSQLARLQDWLKDSKGGDNFLAKTGGIELYTWKPKDPSRYVSLRNPTEDSDPLTKLIMEVLALIFHRLCGERFKPGKIVDIESGLTSYSDSRLVMASNVLALVVSSVLPVLTIFVLNILTTTTARIGFTVLFTAIFSIVLALFSSAKRIEIFAATATFAAIEVVFIGSALGSESGSGTTGSSN